MEISPQMRPMTSMAESGTSTMLEVVRVIRMVRRRQRDRHQLAAMSERELRDLGVGRSQIPGLMKPLA